MRRRTLIAALPLLAAALPAAAASKSEEGAAPKNEFLSLGDFTVNLPPAGRRPGFVVIGVTVEARTDVVNVLKAIAPRVREAVLQRLMDMSSRGQIQPGRTDPLQVKDALSATLTKLQPEGIRDVLITRILHS
jgi:flagellar basal body-associated protein FliL